VTSSTRSRSTRLGGLGLAIAGLLAAPSGPLLAQGQEAGHKRVEEAPRRDAARPAAERPEVNVKEATPAGKVAGGPLKDANEGTRVTGGPVKDANQGARVTGGPMKDANPGARATGGPLKDAGTGNPGTAQPVRVAPAGTQAAGGTAPAGAATGGAGLRQPSRDSGPNPAEARTPAREAHAGGAEARPGNDAAHPLAGAPGQPHVMLRENPAQPGPGVAIVHTRDGGEIHRTPAGVVREVHTPGGAVVHYAPDGMRHVEMARPDGRTVVAFAGGRAGYVQRPLVYHDRELVQRTYLEGGMVRTRVYRPCVYRGITFNVYLPTHYYRPAYYSWAYRPWGRPVAYRWGWGAQPWYRNCGGYYAPYPYYASPVFWLTDFIVSVTLEEAYQARMDSAVAIPPPPPSYDAGMTPEVKQAIADEVRLQVEEERDGIGDGYAAAGGAPPPLFSGNVSRIFLVSHPLPAYDRGREVYLSEGDVLQLNGPPPPHSSYADVVVLASRSGGMTRGRVVSVSLQDLQELQNHMRATLDRGLGDLQSRQGQDGLPPLPPQALGGSEAEYASGLQPDANAAGELAQTAQEGNLESQSLLNQNPAPQAAAQPTAQGGSIGLGMTVEEVQNLLGSPRRTANVGAKRIDIYQDFKVTFLNGRVTDIQ